MIPIASPDGSPLPYRVFDPCIWKQDGIYYCLSDGSCRTGLAAAIGPISSFAPTTWRTGSTCTPLWRTGRASPWSGDDGACPYFWPHRQTGTSCSFSAT